MSSAQEGFLDPPRASYLQHESSDSSQTSSPANSTTALPKRENDEYARHYNARLEKKKRGPVFWLACLAALIVVVLVVILPVYFAVIKKDNNSSSSNADNGSGNDGNGGNTGDGTVPSANGAITGGDGSEVTMEDGSNFTYSNQFGGFWVSDPADPFASYAKPNSWTPALNETWVYGKDRIFGYASPSFAWIGLEGIIYDSVSTLVAGLC